MQKELIKNKSLCHSVDGKDISMKLAQVETYYDSGVELKAHNYIGKVKFKDKTEERLFLSSLSKEFSTHCQHDYDCCGQVYTSARAKVISRNRIKLRIRQFLNV